MRPRRAGGCRPWELAWLAHCEPVKGQCFTDNA